MNKTEPTICINVDVTNPGQFFACCGLLELADRLWGKIEGHFSPSLRTFTIMRTCEPEAINASEFRAKLAACSITSTMSEEQIARLKKLLNQKKSTLSAQDMTDKQSLSKHWEQERIGLRDPFDVWVDWWRDEHAGGSSFKTWAGKQFIIDLVRGLQGSIGSDDWTAVPAEAWLNKHTSEANLPLYFDSDIGGQSSSRDVGFSMDALQIRSRKRPMLELAAFVGLQRFRPFPDSEKRTFSYFPWVEPLSPTLAAVACCGYLPQRRAYAFEFRLLYRTKYLKSFLPAKPKGV